jgi:hypothetical protein
VLKYQDRNGHTTLTYDPTDEKTVAEVKAKFDALIADNYMAYTKTSEGQAVQTRNFDPQERETVAVLPIAGG